MRIFLSALAVLMVAAVCDFARAAETIAPRPACIASDMAAPVDFGADGKPLYFDLSSMREIIRHARACRFRKITLTLFTDGEGRAVANQRAATLKGMLVESDWPPGAITIEAQAMRLAPSGMDRFGAWTAKALISFADPDPGFVPPMMKPGELCSPDPKTLVYKCEPMPWPKPSASRMAPPPPPFDPPRVFFGANQAQLDDRALEFVAEGLRIFRDENYREILLSGQAAPDEPDALALRLRRVAAVRDALVRMGVDPSLIVVEEEPAPDAGGAARSIDMAFFRYVAIDYGD